MGIGISAAVVPAYLGEVAPAKGEHELPRGSLCCARLPARACLLAGLRLRHQQPFVSPLLGLPSLQCAAAWWSLTNCSSVWACWPPRCATPRSRACPATGGGWLERPSSPRSSSPVRLALWLSSADVCLALPVHPPMRLLLLLTCCHPSQSSISRSLHVLPPRVAPLAGHPGPPGRGAGSHPPNVHAAQPAHGCVLCCCFACMPLEGAPARPSCASLNAASTPPPHAPPEQACSSRRPRLSTS